MFLLFIFSTTKLVLYQLFVFYRFELTVMAFFCFVYCLTKFLFVILIICKGIMFNLNLIIKTIKKALLSWNTILKVETITTLLIAYQTFVIMSHIVIVYLLFVLVLVGHIACAFGNSFNLKNWLGFADTIFIFVKFNSIIVMANLADSFRFLKCLEGWLH